MKNVFILALSISAPALLAFGITSQIRYQDLEEKALAFQQDSSWFSVDVAAVDAVTGEAIPRAGLGHPIDFDKDADHDLFAPRISRVYNAERDCTRLSGITDQTITLTISADGYEPAQFEIAPGQFRYDLETLTVELKRENGSALSGLATASLR